MFHHREAHSQPESKALVREIGAVVGTGTQWICGSFVLRMSESLSDGGRARIPRLAGVVGALAAGAAASASLLVLDGFDAEGVIILAALAFCNMALARGFRWALYLLWVGLGYCAYAFKMLDVQEIIVWPVAVSTVVALIWLIHLAVRAQTVKGRLLKLALAAFAFFGGLGLAFGIASLHLGEDEICARLRQRNIARRNRLVEGNRRAKAEAARRRKRHAASLRQKAPDSGCRSDACPEMPRTRDAGMP
jgi:hypothetical protein